MFSSEEKEHYMELVFAEAKKAKAQDEVPTGAIVVDPRGQVIGRGYNRRELDNVATHRAETLAAGKACKTLNSWRLIDCSLFVTLEPCVMCAGAIVNARLKEAFYGAPDHRAGASGNVVDLFTVEKFNHYPQVIRRFYRDKASSMLTNFFRTIRAKQEEKELKAKENKASSSQID